MLAMKCRCAKCGGLFVRPRSDADYCSLSAESVSGSTPCSRPVGPRKPLSHKGRGFPCTSALARAAVRLSRRLITEAVAIVVKEVRAAIGTRHAVADTISVIVVDAAIAICIKPIVLRIKRIVVRVERIVFRTIGVVCRTIRIGILRVGLAD